MQIPVRIQSGPLAGTLSGLATKQLVDGTLGVVLVARGASDSKLSRTAVNVAIHSAYAQLSLSLRHPERLELTDLIGKALTIANDSALRACRRLNTDVTSAQSVLHSISAGVFSGAEATIGCLGGVQALKLKADHTVSLELGYSQHRADRLPRVGRGPFAPGETIVFAPALSQSPPLSHLTIHLMCSSHTMRTGVASCPEADSELQHSGFSSLRNGTM
jgi:hypothetical protein